MDLIDGLKAFVATAQTGSFTEAAERLGVSNRITSKYVAQLEERMGARLLQRTTRKVGLTPIGQELLTRAPALLDELDDLLGSVSEASQGLTGQLRMSAPVTFGEIYITGLISRFTALHPGICVDLRLTDSYVDLAADGFDLAFRIGEPEVNTLKARKLGEINSCLVASPHYLANYGTPLVPEDLKSHLCIVDTNRRDHSKWTFYRGETPVTFTPQRHLLVNSARIARDWAMDGRGIALCPDFVLHDALHQGRLVELLGNYTMKTHPISVVYLAGNVVPRKVRALIDFAVDDFQQVR
ncbi:LysR family transcriptional regulator [Vibrio cidicii]|uniref:LysR family transcriptional regulator n=1 Tax=Vibrio cidicii TaxID=1763883 RepID=A0A151JDB4_9VIBR|nr:LysR family transcriptional regulator [Vibrio cidicii]EJN6826656.1 LysR family transcriptional regulator [Vibrio cidicii]KYN23740.1 LysR family transcriptional regulator [Vibrio cidicii]MBG0759756.1 LysR family transcriptional regulator [Vibrio cidicii]